MHLVFKDNKNQNSQFLISDMKTARPRIPSPLTGAMFNILVKATAADGSAVDDAYTALFYFIPQIGVSPHFLPFTKTKNSKLAIS